MFDAVNIPLARREVNIDLLECSRIRRDQKHGSGVKTKEYNCQQVAFGKGVERTQIDKHRWFVFAIPWCHGCSKLSRSTKEQHPKSIRIAKRH